ncbi:cytochrome P450 [Camelimonas abortus]|uniref:Cytochrome P450 n=1 Tax=Camelimonas abortus TaxID=1017184 RepID=A0ABV7LG42_9HYPH
MTADAASRPDASGPAAGVRAVRPRRRRGPLSVIASLVRNPVAGWPPEIYEAPLVRTRLIGRPAFFVMDPALVHEAMVEKADIFVKDRATRRALGPALGQGILTANGDHWRWQRRLAAPVFRHERLTAMLPAMTAAAEETAARWRALEGAVVDVAHEMMRATFSVIVATMLKDAPDMDVERVARAIADSLESSGWPIALALLGAPSWTPYPGSRRAAAGRRYLRGCMQAAIDARRAAGATGGSDLTSLLLGAADPQTGRRMDDALVIDNLVTFIAAGHETTALALTWTFWLLSQHPDVAARLRAEARAVAPHGVTAENVGQLAYARQTLQEAMRLYPPAAATVRTAREAATLGGERIPRRATLVIPIHAIHRHRMLWPEPERFNPENFAPGAVKARPRHAFMPFGAGPRICIGMGFALLEGTAILATLAREFAPEPAGEIPPEPQLKITLRPRGGLPMRIRRAPAG